MGRTPDALKRRAEKRNRSIDEQIKAERLDRKKRVASTTLPKDIAGDGMVRREGVAKTEKVRVATSPGRLESGGDGVRVVVAPAKGKWAPQASESTIKANEELKKRYLEAGGEGMTEEEVSRAKMLVERSKRKKEKKERLKAFKKDVLGKKIAAVETKKGKDDAVRDGDWVCPRCKNMNFRRRSVCNSKLCNAKKPVMSASVPSELPFESKDWECKKCGNKNFARRTVCNSKTCDEPRPTLP